MGLTLFLQNILKITTKDVSIFSITFGFNLGGKRITLFYTLFASSLPDKSHIKMLQGNNKIL